MLGGHLDSWASATGATDNGIGSSIMLEAARILLETVEKPSRATIRVALWSGEEAGPSSARSRKSPDHFSSGGEHRSLSFRNSTRTGTSTTARGACVARRSSDRRKQPPFSRSTTSRSRTLKPTVRTPSTARVERQRQRRVRGCGLARHRHAAGSRSGYNSTTWHTNLDNYERIVPEDVMHNAVLTASVMLRPRDARRPACCPRFPADQMPPIPPPTRGAGMVLPATTVALVRPRTQVRRPPAACLSATKRSAVRDRGARPNCGRRRPRRR